MSKYVFLFEYIKVKQYTNTFSKYYNDVKYLEYRKISNFIRGLYTICIMYVSHIMILCFCNQKKVQTYLDFN